MTLPASFPGRCVLHEGRWLPNTGPSVAGWHELSEFALCPQRWAYQHLLRLDPKRQVYYDRGTIFHGGVGAAASQLWARQTGHDPDIFWDPLSAVRILSHQLGRPEMQRPVSAAVEAYTEHVLAPSAGEWLVIGVELEVSATVDGKLITRGIDLVRQNTRTHLIQILDHKSRGGKFKRIEKAYENDLTLDFLWKWGANAYGNLFDGVYLSYVDVPKSAARQVTISMELVETKRSPWRESCIPETVRYYRGQLDALVASGTDPWHWPKVQSGFGPCGDCPFLNDCRFGPPVSAAH